MHSHVHGSVQLLRFQAQHLQEVSPLELEAWTATIYEHFPECSAVHLSLPDDSSYTGVSAMLPALARQVGWVLSTMLHLAALMAMPAPLLRLYQACSSSVACAGPGFVWGPPSRACCACLGAI